MHIDTTLQRLASKNSFGVLSSYYIFVPFYRTAVIRNRI